ncbi:hypothetical protein J2Y57_000003 [Sphingomonas sp. BE137]|nr:hypothetical protein [Sphingomonas sp. BE137]MDR6846818.1 hypothetical protein [Sphingomonas sp. BE137]
MVVALSSNKPRRLGPGRNAIGQRGHIAFHRPAQFDESSEGEVVFSALNPTDVAPVQPSLMRQAFLRHSKLATPCADASAKNIEIRVHPPKSRGRGLSIHGVLIPLLTNQRYPPIEFGWCLAAGCAPSNDQRTFFDVIRKGTAVLGFGKRAREMRALECTQRHLLENTLCIRLHGLVDAVAANVMVRHELSLEKIASVEECAENLKAGIDLVLLKKLEWTDARIPKKFHGGATIANSAHASFFAGLSLNDPSIYDLIGTESDAQTIGHISYNLGFTRDGAELRG